MSAGVSDTLRRTALPGSVLRKLIEQSIDGVTVIDERGVIVLYNSSQERITGIARHEAVGRKIWDVQTRLIPSEHRTRSVKAMNRRQNEQMLRDRGASWIGKLLEVEMERSDGQRRYLQTIVFPIDADGERYYGSINRDITDLRAAQSTLEEHSRTLSEKNNALREMLSQLDSEKQLIRRQATENIERLVLPRLAQLRNGLNRNAIAHADIIERELRAVTSSISTRLGSVQPHLTPREMDICALIRQGLSSKQIARLSNIAVRTVELHRYSIRKKLGISSHATNLTSYLRTL